MLIFTLGAYDPLWGSYSNISRGVELFKMYLTKLAVHP